MELFQLSVFQSKNHFICTLNPTRDVMHRMDCHICSYSIQRWLINSWYIYFPGICDKCFFELTWHLMKLNIQFDRSTFENCQYSIFNCDILAESQVVELYTKWQLNGAVLSIETPIHEFQNTKYQPHSIETFLIHILRLFLLCHGE